MAQQAHSDAAVHEHLLKGTADYIKVAFILFALTALEVGAYEVAHRGISMFVKDYLVELLVVLSAAKFALVAAFYMHLKFDGSLLRGIFTFALVIATVVILGLMALMWYLFNHQI
ncbi:MAG: cytochrome C oxidase subunit IV family protein [Gemmatimonadota bacterium]